MTTTLLVRDVGAFSIQLGVIVVAAGAVWRLLKVRQATVTLTFWYLVLAACLLLPICQPRLVPVAPSAADDRTPPSVSPGSCLSRRLLPTIALHLSLRRWWKRQGP
jgi:hypothetical protein